MKLRLTPRATEDLSGIADYIREHNPSAAQHVRAAIFETLQALVQFPRAARRRLRDRTIPLPSLRETGFFGRIASGSASGANNLIASSRWESRTRHVSSVISNSRITPLISARLAFNAGKTCDSAMRRK